MKKFKIHEETAMVLPIIPTLLTIIYLSNWLDAKIHDHIGVIPLLVSFIVFGMSIAISNLAKTDIQFSVCAGITVGTLFALINSILIFIVNAIDNRIIDIIAIIALLIVLHVIIRYTNMNKKN